jgi:hypothetical protein
MYILENEKDLQNNYEKLEDTLMDRINYDLFALSILRKMRDKK